MSDTKHTPGPWHVKPEDSGVVYGPPHSHPQAAHLGVPIQSEPIVCFVRGYTGSSEAEANAHLIAAAPEMLEACRMTLAYLKRVALASSIEAQEFLGAAIAKAEGQKVPA